MKISSILKGRTKTKLLVLSFVGFGMFSMSTTYDKYFEIAKNIEIFTNLYKEINTYYVDDVDPAKLMRTGIDAMLESLDPYTNYISEAEMAGFRLQITGKYGGIGASIRKQGDYVVVTEPYENFPAHKAGLQAGDKIVAINGKSAKGKDSKEISEVLRGAPGDEVKITIERPGESSSRNVTLEREEVRIPNVPYSGMVDDKTAYITLTTFSEKAGEHVADALEELKKDHDVQSVILDLRGNGGGLLREAINVSNVFVPKNEEIVTTRGKIKDWDKKFKTLNKPVDEEIPLVVLIDNSSASASEIVSGVIQDLDRGILIGQKSYGKGLVQNTRDVGFNSKVKLTTAKYYIPSGRCIQSVSYKDGKAVENIDSLRATFQTRGGRTVYDGGGVTPDINLTDGDLGKITQALLRNDLIFDYATEFKQKNSTIAAANQFSLTDDDYREFEQFVTSKELKYETSSERALRELEEKAKKEKYFDAVETDLANAKKRIAEDKKNDLYKYKDEVADILEREIVSRYYFQQGRIEFGLAKDAEIKEAIKLFADEARYKDLLTKK